MPPIINLNGFDEDFKRASSHIQQSNTYFQACSCVGRYHEIALNSKMLKVGGNYIIILFYFFPFKMAKLITK